MHRIDLDSCDLEGDDTTYPPDILEAPSMSATFVSSLARGRLIKPNPADIRLPRAYYANLKHKKLLDSPPVLNPLGGRGSHIRHLIKQSEEASKPGDRGRQTNHEAPPGLDGNFLGASTRGLTSEVMAGKVCLMEKFLGTGVIGMPTVPSINLSSREQFPNIPACASEQGTGRPCRQQDGSGLAAKSLQDIMKSISSGSNWKTASLPSDGKRNGRAEPDKNRQSRKSKRNQRDLSARISSDERSSKESIFSSGGAFEDSETRLLCDAINGISMNQQNGVPSGGNLIQLEALPSNITESLLTATLNGFGPVIECNILRDTDTQECIGIAYARFENTKSCLRAIAQLNGQPSPFHGIEFEGETPKLLVCMVNT